MRSVTITCAPRSANASAIARPRPWAAPVTKATRPSWVFSELFIGHPSPLACRLESRRPPQQVVDHDVGLLVQLRQACVDIPALEMRPECRYGNVNTRSDRRHLKFDRYRAKLLDASRAHCAAVARKGGGFAVPLRVNPIERIFQHRGGAVVVFRCNENKSIRSCNLSGPLFHHVMFVRRPARHRGRRGLVEERHREVAKIEKPRFNPLPLAKLLKNPLRRLF